MPAIDNRIVNMLFENKDFEKNAKETMNTLDKLEQKLKLPDGEKAFENISRAADTLNLSGIRNGLEGLSDRFSSMGIVGMRVLQNLTDSAVNLGKKLLTAIPNQIIQGGKTRALNIEQAKFQLAGLGVEWDDIYDNIDKAVKGTAYGLDEAAKIASQLAASGLEYGSEDSDMAHALRGISGVAAMTNSSYEDIGSIFTTVAGQGQLMTFQLRQLESRGLNAAAKLGDALGYTEAQIRDMVTKGKIDFRTFANAMDECFGEHATKANETFTGALSNMKAALSRIGADYAAPTLNTLRDIFNSLRTAFDKVRAITKPFGENEFTGFMDWLSEFSTNEISKWDFSWMEGAVDTLRKTAEGLQKYVPIIVEMLNGQLVDKSFIESALIRRGAGGSVDLLARPLVQASELVKKGWKDAGDGIATLYTSTYSFDDDQGAINLTPIYTDANGNTQILTPEQLDEYAHDLIEGVREDDLGLQIGAEFTGTAAVERAEQAAEEIHKLQERYYLAQPVMENLSQALSNLWDTVTGIGTSISEAWNQIFPGSAEDKMLSFSETLTAVSEKVESVTEKVKNFLVPSKQMRKDVDEFGNVSMVESVDVGDPSVQRAIHLRDTFGGLFAVLDMGKQAVEGLWRGLKKLFDPISSKIGPLTDKFLELFGGWGRWLKDLDKSAEESDFFGKNFEAAADWILNASQNIKDAFDRVKAWVEDAWNTISEWASGLWEKFGPTLTSIWEHLQKFWENIKSFFTNIAKGDRVQIDTSSLSGVFDWIKDNIDWDSILNFVGKIFEFIEAIVEGVLKVTDAFLGGDAEGAANGMEMISQAMIGLAGVNLGTSLATGASAILGFIGSLGALLTSATLEWNSATFKSIATSILELAGALFVISIIDEASLDRAMGALMTLLTAITLVFKILNYSGSAPTGTQKLGNTISGFFDLFTSKIAVKLAQGSMSRVIKAIGIAVLELAGAVWLLSTIDPDRLSGAIFGVVALIAALTGAFLIIERSLQKSPEPLEIGFAMNRMAAAMKGISVAVLILSLSVKLLSTIENPDTLWNAVGAIIALIVLMAIVMQLLANMVETGGDSGNTDNNIANNVLKMAAGMLVISLALQNLVLSVALLAVLNVGQMWSAVGAVAVLLIIMTTIMAVMVQLAQSGGTHASTQTSAGTILAMAFGMIVIASAVQMLAVAVAGLSLLDPGALGVGMAAVVGLLSSLFVAVYALSKISTDTSAGSLMAIGATILILAISMSVVAAAVKKLSKLDPVGVAVGVGALVIALFAMVGALALLNTISNHSEGGAGALAGMAASILILAVAMRVIAPAIAMLSGIGIGAVLTGILGIALALGVFIAAAWAMEKLNLDTAMFKLGAAIGLFGIGLLAAAIAITLFSGSLAAFGIALIGFLGIVLTGILTLAPLISMAVIALVEAVVDALVGSIDTIITGIGVLVVAVVSALVKYLPVILAGLGVLITSVLEFLASMLPSIIDDLIKLTLILINSLSIAIVQNGEAIGTAIRTLCDSIMAFVWEALDGVFGPVISKLFPDFYANMEKSMNKNSDKIVSELENENAALREGMAKNGEAMREGWDEAISGLDPAEDLLEESDEVEAAAECLGENSGEEYKKGFAEAVSTEGMDPREEQQAIRNLGVSPDTAESSGEEAGSSFKNSLVSAIGEKLGASETGFDIGSLTGLDTMDLESMASEMGIDVGSLMASGVQEGAESGASLDLSSMVSLDNVDADGIGSQFSAIGTSATTAASESIGEGAGAIESSTSAVVDSAIDTAKTEAQSGSRDVGYYLDQGTATGIIRNVHIPVSAARSMMRQTVNAMRNEAMVESPSRVTMAIGQYISEGLAIGIADMAHLPESAAIDATEDTLNGMRNTLQRVRDVLTGDLDMSMTIRPVVDLTNVRESAQEMNSLLNSRPASLSANVKVPQIELARSHKNQNASDLPGSVQSPQITNNFYVQDMDQAHIDYFVRRINADLGARV